MKTKNSIENIITNLSLEEQEVFSKSQLYFTSIFEAFLFLILDYNYSQPQINLIKWEAYVIYTSEICDITLTNVAYNEFFVSIDMKKKYYNLLDPMHNRSSFRIFSLDEYANKNNHDTLREINKDYVEGKSLLKSIFISKSYRKRREREFTEMIQKYSVYLKDNFESILTFRDHLPRS